MKLGVFGAVFEFLSKSFLFEKVCQLLIVPSHGSRPLEAPS
jgi:hypothetical protein